MEPAVQNNLRKYQTLCWIHALEQGWHARGGRVTQPPTLANLAMHMLDEEVYPAGVLDRFGTEITERIPPTEEQAALAFLKRHLNRLCQRYRSAGLVKYLTPADLETDHLQEAYANSDAHDLEKRNGCLVVKKTTATHLDRKKGWATDNRFVRILHLTDWGRVKSGVAETPVDQPDPLTNFTALDTHFAAKQVVSSRLSIEPATDTITIPQATRHGWELTTLTVARIEIIHATDSTLHVRDLDTQEVETLSR